MNRTIVVAVSVFALAIVVCFLIYSVNNRYLTANAGDGVVYRVDRRTGGTVLLRGAREIPVEKAVAGKESKEEKAIRLAKNAATLTGGVDNDYEIREFLRKQTGPLRVLGWEAKSAGDETYVVTYSFDRGAGPRRWAFEVNLHADLVRNIIGDVQLEAKYGFAR